MTTELETLDGQISDLIELVDIGILNDIYLDAILNTDRHNSLSVNQKRTLLKFVLNELENVEREPVPEIPRSEPINIIEHKKNMTV